MLPILFILNTKVTTIKTRLVNMIIYYSKVFLKPVNNNKHESFEKDK
jgi:hypothetical protein